MRLEQQKSGDIEISKENNNLSKKIKKIDSGQDKRLKRLENKCFANKASGSDINELSEYERRIFSTPERNGKWSGKRGESVFESNDKSVNKKLAEYGKKGVAYKEGIPDFSPFTNHNDGRWGEFEGKAEIGKIKSRKMRIEAADEMLANKVGTNFKRIEMYRRSKNFVWHESGDGKTMQLIPREIHDTFKHMETSSGFRKNEYRNREKNKPEAEEKIKKFKTAETTDPMVEAVDNTVRNILDQNVKKQKKPSKERVIWSDKEREGNSRCELKDNVQFAVHEKSTGKDIVYTGKEFKEKMIKEFGTDSVEYRSREPDFSPFEHKFDKKDFNEFLHEKYGKDHSIKATENADGSVVLEAMPVKRIGRGGTFDMASSRIAEKMGVNKQDVDDYMKSRDLTWHECGDRRTIMAIPSAINQVFTHTGGIGIEKDRIELKKLLHDKWGIDRYSLQRDSFEGQILYQKKE